MGYTTGEAKLTKKIIEYLDSLMEGGSPVFYDHRSGSGGYNYKKGIPDLWVSVNGYHLEVELKAPKGKLSTMQEKFKYRCESIYNIPYCCPRTLEEFVDFLAPFLRSVVIDI